MANKFKLEDNTEEFGIALDRANKKGLTAAINIVRNELLDILSGTRGGREYLKPGTATKYKASAPGEAPATATGRLRNSYEAEVDEQRELARLGTKLDYGLFLEVGTRNIKPRPHLRVAFERARQKAIAAIKKALAQELND